ncbi:MAG: hypothetical protein JWO63_127 [Frankiales bacterium]|nr:hypothetical protein [Frankiales bacterium]
MSRPRPTGPSIRGAGDAHCGRLVASLRIQAAGAPRTAASHSGAASRWLSRRIRRAAGGGDCPVTGALRAP